MTLNSDEVFNLRLIRIAKGVRASDSEFKILNYNEFINTIELLSYCIKKVFENDIQINPDMIDSDPDYALVKVASDIFYHQITLWSKKNGVNLESSQGRSTS